MFDLQFIKWIIYIQVNRRAGPTVQLQRCGRLGEKKKKKDGEEFTSLGRNEKVTAWDSN